VSKKCLIFFVGHLATFSTHVLRLAIYSSRVLVLSRHHCSVASGEATLITPVRLSPSSVTWDRSTGSDAHLEHVVARCNKRLNLLKVMPGTRWGASKDVLLLVYKALIRSLIDYGCTAYDSASQTIKSKLDSIQTKALRI